MKHIVSGMILVTLVSACSTQPSQNQYSYSEVGQAVSIEYALVVGAKPVGITGRASDTPTTKSGVAGSYIESGINGLWTTAGAAAQQVEAERKGYEYIVVTEAKATKTIVQYQNAEDIVFAPGDIVMLQQTGSFHRLLTTANLPDRIIAPHQKVLSELYDPAPPPAPKAAAVESVPVPVPAAPALEHNPSAMKVAQPEPGK